MSQTTELKRKEEATQLQGAQHLLIRPRVDLFETDAGWTLRAEMPGVDEQHVEVILERQVLTVAGTAETPEPQGLERKYGEFRPRRYERAFRLPDEVERSGLEAVMRHGVLTVQIPKAKTAQPTRIAVKGA